MSVFGYLGRRRAEDFWEEGRAAMVAVLRRESPEKGDAAVAAPRRAEVYGDVQEYDAVLRGHSGGSEKRIVSAG